MPLLRLSQSIFAARQISSEDVFDVPAERVISQGRIVLCALSLLAVRLDPTDPQKYAQAAFWLLVGYSIFAVALAVLSLRGTLSQVSRLVSHTIDIIAVSGLLALTEGSGSPFFAYFTFILLAATLRWDWPGVAGTAIVLAIVFLAVTLTQRGATLAIQPDDLDLNRAIIRGAYLLVTGGMLAYVSAYRERTHDRLVRLAKWSARETDHEDPAFARVLAHAASVLNASRVLVLWDEGDEPDLNVALWSSDTYRRWRELSGTYERAVARDLRHTTFSSEDPRSGLVQLDAGSARVTPPLIDSDLVSSFQMGPFTTATFEGTICKGRVFVLDRGSWRDDHLLLTDIVAARIGTELDREALQLQTEQAAVMRERSRFTRDIHDGLLQSLTAAGLQLKVLAERASSESRSKLEMIKDLLANEQRRIRTIIQTFEPKTASAPAFRLDQDLRDLLNESQRHWDCSISLTVTPSGALISSTLGTQISFIAMEAIANAVRHGGATEISIALESTANELVLAIRDNGCGFQGNMEADLINKHTIEHLSPATIQARVSELKGTLHVFDSPQGAALQIRLPI